MTAGTSAQHARATLGILTTRTARANRVVPLLLLAPDATVELPFASGQVGTTVLRVPREAKGDGRFHKRMLDAADPKIAALPSPNTVKPRGPRGPRRLPMPDSLNALTAQIHTSDPVMVMLEPAGRDGMLGAPMMPAVSNPDMGEHRRAVA